MDLVLAEELVIGLLAFLCGNESLDIHHAYLESRIEPGELLLLHLEHCGTVRLVHERGVHVDIELVTRLRAHELGVSLTLDAADCDICILDCLGII